MVSCNFTEQEIESSLKTDNYTQESIRAGSDKLLSALWRSHPERMRYLFSKGLAARPNRNISVYTKVRPIIVDGFGPALGTRLVNSVAADFGLTAEQIRSRSHSRPFVVARSIICTVLYERGWSMNQIARTINRNDHSTIANCLKRINYFSMMDDMVGASLEKNRVLFGSMEKNDG